MSKKEYYARYHRENYVPKPRFCIVCNKDLTGVRKKKCDDCRINCTCSECGKEFTAKHQSFPRCSKCQYKWYKENHPEKFDKSLQNVYDKIAKRRRDEKGLPIGHNFFTGPRKEGYTLKGYKIILLIDPETGKYIRRT